MAHEVKLTCEFKHPEGTIPAGTHCELQQAKGKKLLLRKCFSCVKDIPRNSLYLNLYKNKKKLPFLKNSTCNLCRKCANDNGGYQEVTSWQF